VSQSAANLEKAVLSGAEKKTVAGCCAALSSLCAQIRGVAA